MCYLFLQTFQAFQQIINNIEVIGMNSQFLVQPDEFFQAGELFGLHIHRLPNVVVSISPRCSIRWTNSTSTW